MQYLRYVSHNLLEYCCQSVYSYIYKPSHIDVSDGKRQRTTTDTHIDKRTQTKYLCPILWGTKYNSHENQIDKTKTEAKARDCVRNNKLYNNIDVKCVYPWQPAARFPHFAITGIVYLFSPPSPSTYFVRVFLSQFFTVDKRNEITYRRTFCFFLNSNLHFCTTALLFRLVVVVLLLLLCHTHDMPAGDMLSLVFGWRSMRCGLLG